VAIVHNHDCTYSLIRSLKHTLEHVTVSMRNANKKHILHNFEPLLFNS
jgi:hypothetical protein